MTLPTAFAAPVADGMMFAEAQRPPRQSLPPRLGPSTVSCVAVMAWTVVIKPSTMVNFSWTTFVSGAGGIGDDSVGSGVIFVVHAHDIHWYGILGGCGNDDLLTASATMQFRLGFVCEDA